MVEAITTATGIKAAVDWFSEATGIDCGCEERKEKLNKLVRFSRVECLTKEEYDWLDGYYKAESAVLDVPTQERIATIHARIFNHKYHLPCSCTPSRWRTFIEELRVVYNEYNYGAS